MTFHLARVLASDPALAVHLSVSRQAEIFARFASLDLPRLDVDTYGSATTVALALPRVLAARVRLGQYLRDCSIDVVLCTMTHVWNTAMLGAIRRAGARYVLVLHDAALRDTEDVWLRRRLMARETQHADAIVTLCDHVRAQVADVYGVSGGKVSVVPMGMLQTDDREMRPRTFPSGRPFRLLFFGRLLAYKGLDLLLDAFEILVRTVPAVELVVAGSGTLDRRAAARASALGVQVVNQWIPESGIDGFFQAADAVVLPYRDASQSGVVVHAFEHRVPVVATPVGGLAEQVAHRQTGVIASMVSPQAFADAVAALATSPTLYEACSREIGRTISSSTSWSKVGAAMSAILRHVRD